MRVAIFLSHSSQEVSDTRIVIAVNSEDAELDLPERCRILKLVNSVTYDRLSTERVFPSHFCLVTIRMDKALQELESTFKSSAVRSAIVLHAGLFLTYCLLTGFDNRSCISDELDDTSSLIHIPAI